MGFRVDAAEAIATPALLIDAEAVDANVGATLRLLGGHAERWRPHLKTAKLLWTMRRLPAAGVMHAKCATTLELETACGAGFADVLLAYAVTGPHIERVHAIAARFPAVRASALVESADGVAAWCGSGVSLFVDVNLGMDRTGAPLDAERLEAIVRGIGAAGLEWRGLHAYDGHAAGYPAAEAKRRTHESYDALAQVALALRARGFTAGEIVTAGTPAFRHAAGCRRLTDAGFNHTLSPGTVVYNDFTSLAQLPLDAGFRPAAVVLSRVVSHPLPTRFTCDAGHKSVSADAGEPTCRVLDHPDWRAGHPSEEHLPVDVAEGTALPARGTLLQLLPRHICPTVNNFDAAVIVEGGAVAGVERVTARGHHPPVGSTRTA